MIVSLTQIQAFGTCLLVGLGLGLLYDCGWRRAGGSAAYWTWAIGCASC